MPGLDPVGIRSFSASWNPKEVALEGGSDTKVLSRPALVPRPFSYEVPTIELTPAPIRITTLFDLLDVRSARDLEKLITSFSKELQDAVIRAYKRKEEGTLVDLTVGCTKVTLNKPVAEALWKKYQYFLAQTDFQCEIAPTSDFRDYIKQSELKRKEAKGGPPVANPLDSKHVVGDAVDQSARCQDQSDRQIPFDFNKDGGVIFVRLDGKGLRPANVLEDPSTRKAIVDRRKAEFPDDYKRLQASGGDMKIVGSGPVSNGARGTALAKRDGNLRRPCHELRGGPQGRVGRRLLFCPGRRCRWTTAGSYPFGTDHREVQG